MAGITRYFPLTLALGTLALAGTTAVQLIHDPGALACAEASGDAAPGFLALSRAAAPTCIRIDLR